MFPVTTAITFQATVDKTRWTQRANRSAPWNLRDSAAPFPPRPITDTVIDRQDSVWRGQQHSAGARRLWIRTMQVIQHSSERLRNALVSNRQDLVALYQQYSPQERRLMEDGLRPDNKGRKVIYVQTIGSFGETEGLTKQYVGWLQDYCEAFYYGLTVKFLDPVTVAATGCAFRVNDNTHNLQIHAGDLLNFLLERKPKDAFCIVGITMIDLYPKDSWNFVFGQASLTEGMGVFSFARYDDNFYSRSYKGRLEKGKNIRKGDYSVFDGYYTPPITSSLLLRSCKTVTHEIGHMFGILHCQWLQCVMQGSNHLEESDRRPLDLCPVCLRKLQSALQFKMADRYRALLHWMEDPDTSEKPAAQPTKPTQAFEGSRQWLRKCLRILKE
ncbi:hypothetical protein GJAV_G00267430 [Gymnothorax javanicus]|nr:hypothetical protein GJAV_G00267430 [Gymnothorax javanicus]